MKVLPATLEIGDYVLSPSICVERKSLSDLISSLQSGRLFNQLKAMGLFYGIPVLLIEFDPEKPFQLVDKSEIEHEVTAHSVTTKLSLLTLHIPNLKIIWSQGPHSTASMFAKIKAKQDEPDLNKAKVVGTDRDADEADVYSMTPQEVLASLPGVSSKNLLMLLNHVRNLRHLCELTREQLTELIGADSAKKLFFFLHSDSTLS